MMKPRNLSGRAGEVARYFGPGDEGRRRDEYFTAGAEAALPGPVWYAPGEGLGVRDGSPVEPAALQSLLQGRHPETGKALVQVQRSKAGQDLRRPGTDWHLSPPKSVSVMIMTADPAERAAMVRELRAAARSTVQAMHERGAFLCRSGKGGRTQEPAASIAVALVPHVTSRAGDPQTHIHVLQCNVCVKPNGRTGTVEQRPAMKMIAEAGALFRAEVVRTMLEPRGLAVVPVPGQDKQRSASFEVAGISPELCRAFSKRSQAMLQAVAAREPRPGVAGTGIAENGRARRKQMTAEARASRPRKSVVPSPEALEARWRQELASHGIDGHGVWQRAREAAERVQRPLLSPAEVVALEVKRAGGKMPERRVRQRIAEHAQYQGAAGGIAGALREVERFVRDGWEKLAAHAERLVERAQTLAREAVERVRDAWRSSPDRGGAGRAREVERGRGRERDRGHSRER